MVETIATVREMVEYAVSKNAEKDFLRFYRGNEIVSKSYQQFYNDCLSVCRYVRSTSNERKHIGFIGKTNYEYIACLTGMIFSGNVVVPFAPDIEGEAATLLFNDSDIEVLFFESEFEEKAKEFQAQCPKLKTLICLGDYQWFESIFEKYKNSSEFEALSDFEEKPDETALIIYTSGTTGNRKGVMLSNRNLASNTCYRTYSMEDDDVCLSVLPMHHVFCYACDVLKTLFDGGTICLCGELIKLYSSLLAFQPTVMRIVPSLCKSLMTRVKVVERRNPSLSKREAAEAVFGKNLKRLIVGSAFLSSAMIDEFEKYGICARMGYGMSECSPRITTSDFSNTCKYSNGRLLGTDEVRIVDGEIQVKGPSVMLGYYKRPQETAAAFTADGFLHTGDLGCFRNDHIYLIGRQKNIIVLSNGENISPEEIENRFVDDGLIKEVIVLGRDDRLVAEIYPNYELAGEIGFEQLNGEIEKIIDRVNLELASDRQIFTYHIRKEPFARTSTGKIKRAEFLY